MELGISAVWPDALLSEIICFACNTGTFKSHNNAPKLDWCSKRIKSIISQSTFANLSQEGEYRRGIAEVPRCIPN